MEWLLYLLLGAVAGVLAGLFGVGGGVVIVPILLLVFDALRFAPELAVHTAVGTSFATIVLTTLAATRAHHAMGNVDWPLWRVFLPGLLAGVGLGAAVASLLQPATLRAAIAVFLLLVSIQMLSRWQPPRLFEHESARLHIVAAALVGWFSAFFGIGGGSLTVPYLNACGRTMKAAVATSAACGVPIALAGALSYMLLGWQRSSDIVWTSGYLYWPAVLGIALASVPCARYGARLASAVPDLLLRRLFAMLMMAMGLYLVGSANTG